MKKSKALDVILIIGSLSIIYLLFRGCIGAFQYWSTVVNVIPKDQTNALLFWIMILFSILMVAGEFAFQLAANVGNALEHLFKKQKGGRNE